ncbi:hypothetical protein CMO90_02170 [Candidatus Woesearchaeota archaeon]|nr:hypothetical protein [Candidatus Woesearchaeota archaeon]|tara:strand:- start:793 stop:1944 length:1152 start_codon:yes stop_codon:yes gene_type:complete
MVKKKKHVVKKFSKSKKSNRNSNLYIALGAFLILFALYNILQTSSFLSLFDEKLAEAKEAARPADLQMTIIQNINCDDCFNIQTIIDSIKKSNVNIISEQIIDFDSNEAIELIQKYSVDKVPSVLLFGEIEKVNIRNLEESDNVLVFRELTPPYTESATGDVKGRVSSTILLDSSCDFCVDLTQILNSLKESGIAIVSEKTIDRNSAEGQSLISKYDFESLPVLILSSDMDVYSSEIIDFWNQIGTIESDAYVSTLTYPPYVDLIEDRVVGFVSMTILEDESCVDCYDPDNFHKPILSRMGVVFGEEKRVDISSSEGQALLDKYSITKVPTVILEGEPEVYPVLVNAWQGVGSVEDDGVYVFRQVEVARQTYKDLSSGEIIQP